MDTTQSDLELFRKYCGSNSIVTSTHLNQNYDGSFASINRNIQINIAKLRDFIKEAQNE